MLWNGVERRLMSERHDTDNAHRGGKQWALLAGVDNREGGFVNQSKRTGELCCSEYRDEGEPHEPFNPPRRRCSIEQQRHVWAASLIYSSVLGIFNIRVLTRC